MTSSAPAARSGLRLLLRAGDRKDARLHALCDLNLMQAQPAPGARHEHGLPGRSACNAKRRAHAGADRTDRKRRRGHVEAIGYGDGIARRDAGELGVAAGAFLAEHATCPAEIMPAAQAMAAAAAEQALIDHHPLADALRCDAISDCNDLAGNLMAKHASGATTDLAGAGQHVVIADARGMDAHEHIAWAGLRPLELAHFKNMRCAEGRERNRLHARHSHRSESRRRHLRSAKAAAPWR